MFNTIFKGVKNFAGMEKPPCARPGFGPAIGWGLWLGFRIRAYGKGLGSSFRFRESGFGVRV